MKFAEDRDPLTGLVRAGTLQARLDARRRQAEYAAEADPGYTLVLVDVVALRHVNRDLGVEAGDELLRQVAHRLDWSGWAELVARVGPDEFALLVEGVGPEDGGQWVRGLRSEVLHQPFELAGRSVEVAFHVTRRAGPPPPGWDLLWQVERDARVDDTRELRQRLDAYERAFADAETALRENLQLRTDLEMMRELAFRDPLTGLLNRRGMHDRLVELALSGSPFALAFVDLDDLRALNALDQLWEDGDRAITGVAMRLHEAFGSVDVARWGGDEYLVTAPGTDATALGQALERILEACRHELVVSGRPITFSAGVATCDQSLDTARDAAEAAVKAAKALKASVVVV